MLLAVDDLEARVGDVPLLAPISLHADGGEVVALRGPNGAGKTTLLRVVAGVIAPSAGSVLIDGLPADERRRAFRRAVAALIGLPPMARDLTLTEHLTMVALSWGADASDAEVTASALLARLGLRGFGRRFPHELSSGQTQLFAVATVLSRPSALLVLDEPEQRLDADHLVLVADLLAERVAAGTAVLMATHSDRLVALLGARSVVLSSADAQRDD